MDKTDKRHLKLSKLTESELEELILLLKGGALAPSFLTFVPHDGQAAVMVSTANETLFIGGNQGGKTTTAVNLACMFATGEYPKWFPKEARITVPNRGRICGPSAKGWSMDVLAPRLKQILPEEFVQRWVYNTQSKSLEQVLFKNGSVIDVMSYRQELMEFHSWTGHWAMFDEPPDRDVYLATVRGLAANNGRLYFFMTPWTQPWIAQLTEDVQDEKRFGSKIYYEASRTVDLGDGIPRTVSTRVVPMSTDDNLQHKNWLGITTGGMSEEGLANFVSKMTKEEQETGRYGRFVHFQGLIYKEFRDAVHVLDEGDVPSLLTYYFVLDPADSRPHSLAWYGVDANDTVYCVYDEAFDGDLDQLAERIKKVEAEQGWLVHERILDPNKGRTPTSVSRATWQEELNNRDLWFTTEVTDDIELGHQKVRAALSYTDKVKPRVFFVRGRAQNTTHSLKHYVYKEDRSPNGSAGVKPIPQHKYKDFPDCLRYMIMYDGRFVSAPLGGGYHTGFNASDFSTSTTGR